MRDDRKNEGNERDSKSEQPAEASKNDGIRGQGDEAMLPKEVGGRKGPDPTRYGDWEKNGRCIDF